MATGPEVSPGTTVIIAGGGATGGSGANSSNTAGTPGGAGFVKVFLDSQGNNTPGAFCSYPQP
ncbi:MAG: hypothetical protein IPN02_06810 [Candidatus Microthrix sp.]|uniref:Uncharacterized protein n=1 Tax=Candidatus Neomicrothrix subdominans TaxID=2954438 RepID=A0A936NAC2_9ACTN|nr:hypothetical protein [Candidatus Microthrix subdominans]